MRDFTEEHPKVVMDGDQPCALCKFVGDMGWCHKHKVEVSFFDGCKDFVRATREAVNEAPNSQ